MPTLALRGREISHRAFKSVSSAVTEVRRHQVIGSLGQVGTIRFHRRHSVPCNLSVAVPSPSPFAQNQSFKGLSSIFGHFRHF